MNLKAHSIVSLFTCSCMVCMAASPASVGVLVTNGQAMVDGATVHGNSTLFQGSVVKADEITSDLRFADGANLVLQPGAAAKVYRDHAELQQGTAIQRGVSGHALVADGLRVTSLEPNGKVTVAVQDNRHVEMLANDGAAEVRTPTGELVARLEPGKPLTFNIREVTKGTNVNAYAGGKGQAGGAAPAAYGTVWTTGSVIFVAAVAAGGTVLGLAAAGDLGNGPSHPVSTP
jgi:hypothetical protein